MTKMKEVIKKSMLALVLFMATQTYSNDADSIIINNEESKLVKIERLKAGSILKIKDEFGMTLHKEIINNSGYYSKSFDLSELPEATYYFELDNDDEIRTIPVVIKNQKAERLFGEESRIAKPQVKIDGNLVHLQQSSIKEQDLFITIYYEGGEVAFEESIKDVQSLKRSYDFTSSLKGDYTLVVNTGGRSFTNRINISQND